VLVSYGADEGVGVGRATAGKVMDYMSYITCYMRICKAVRLAVCLGSIIMWNPCVR
jgi:hypothetical protein